jgi:hypothetical protein
MTQRRIATKWWVPFGLVYDLAALIPGTRATWLLVAVALTALFFALFAFICDRTGHKIIAAFLAAGAWLFTGFGVVVVWFWR